MRLTKNSHCLPGPQGNNHFSNKFKMSCSRYDPLGPVTTDTLNGSPLDATKALSLASFMFPSALNMSSNPGSSREVRSGDESVTEFRLTRSLVASLFSMKGNIERNRDTRSTPCLVVMEC